MNRCPTCNAPNPHLHPAVQHEGETEICTDAFHLDTSDRSNRPEWIDKVHAKRAAKGLPSLRAA